MTKREVMDTWARRVWAEEDVSAIYELYVPEGRALWLGEEHEDGPKAFEAFHQALLRLISNVRMEFVESAEEGDWLGFSAVLHGVDRATGKPVQMTGCCMCKIVGDAIVDAHNAWDFLGLFCQLGFLPEDTFMKALTGQLAPANT